MEPAYQRHKTSVWAYAWFGGWGVCACGVIACAMGLHAATLPAPVEGTRVGGITVRAGDCWQMVHVLASDCPCSEAVARRLLERGPTREAVERVYVVGRGESLTAALVGRGFVVEEIGEERLAREFGIEGGPWLMVVSPDGRRVYSGGYGPRRVRDPGDVRDMEVLANLRVGGEVGAYPAYGCATSRSLRAAMDPLGLKY